MNKVNIPVSLCNTGDVLAETVYSERGITLVARNSVINDYIKRKMIELDITNVWIYEPLGALSRDVKTVMSGCAGKIYKDAVLAVKQLLYELSVGGSIDYIFVKNLSGLIFSEINECNSIIHYLSAIRNADEYTYTHCVNVAFYSMLIAKWLGLSDEMIKEIVKAGLLHDIGKTRVPNNILNKNGRLTPEEFEIIKNHSKYGYEMLKNTPGFNEDILQAILQHHERMGGSGYPSKLTGEDIGLYAKIIAISDVYDAMTQNRIYKQKVSPFESFEMFLTTGFSNYDSNILKIFLVNLSVYYVGTKVLLNNGEKGEIVYVPPQDIACPVINMEQGYVDLFKKKKLKVVAIIPDNDEVSE